MSSILNSKHKIENIKWKFPFFLREGLWLKLIVVSLFAFHFSSAQNITATLKADSTHLVIGDFLKVKFTVKSPKEKVVIIPTVFDTIGNMEWIKSSKIDTTLSGNTKIFSQTFTVSAYDSGKYHLGPIAIYAKDIRGSIDTILSDFTMINVATVAVDTSKEFKPIKAPLSVPYTLKEFLPYIIGGAALLIAIIVALYFILTRKKKKPIVIERPKPKDPAHIWARKELKLLEEEKLWQHDEQKKYYSKLTDILRLYLEYRYNWFALESTTEEINEEIKSFDISDQAKNNLLMILEQGDLVKFAKMHMPPDANMKVMENAYCFIQLTEQEIKAAGK